MTHCTKDDEHDQFRRNFVREIELMVDQMALAWCRVPEVRALWYGDTDQGE